MSVLDRDAALRTSADVFADFDANPAARVLLARGGELAMRAGALDWRAPGDAPAGRRVYLGKLSASAAGLPAGSPLELRVLDAERETLSALSTAAGITEFSLDVRRAVHALAEAELELVLPALAMANWLDVHRFCPRCAAPLEQRQAGWALECAGCGRQLFPRIDPAVIVLVTDRDDRVLLGSNALWEQRRFSLLAGFVEPGESLERAVEREVFEESGVRVHCARYLASQSWPFPASLMLGFGALAEQTETTPDGEEILELIWLSREQLATADVLLPGPASLAHRLLRDWYGQPLPESK